METVSLTKGKGGGHYHLGEKGQGNITGPLLESEGLLVREDTNPSLMKEGGIGKLYVVGVFSTGKRPLSELQVEGGTYT